MLGCKNHRTFNTLQATKTRKEERWRLALGQEMSKVYNPFFGALQLGRIGFWRTLFRFCHSFGEYFCIVVESAQCFVFLVEASLVSVWFGSCFIGQSFSYSKLFVQFFEVPLRARSHKQEKTTKEEPKIHENKTSKNKANKNH